MLGVFSWVLVFVLSLFILIKASDYFTHSAKRIGLSLRIPAFIIGVTLVAIGTSLPELASSIFAVLRGSSEIVVGNVIGSNIANIFLILGITVVTGGSIQLLHELIRVDLPLLVGASLLLTVSIWDGIYSLPEAFLSLALLGIYLSYTASTQKKIEDTERSKKVAKKIKADIRKKERKLEWKTFLIFSVSLGLIYVGAKYTVESIINLSGFLNIGTEVIALSAVSIGTSLPELAVSISAVKNKNAEIAVGNILGSTIFNSLAVMGIPALFGNLIIPDGMLRFGLPMMVIAVLLYFFITQDKQITLWEGWLLIIFYVFFIGKVLGIV